MVNLTTTQAARLRKVNPSTVRRWCEYGGLKAEKIGRDWIIDKDDLDNFTPPRPGPKESR